jgi:Domain of unknown function (DUF4384)
MDTISHFKILSKRSLCLTAFLCLTMVALAGMQNTVQAKEDADKPPIRSNDGLRGVYYGTSKQDSEQDKVGKLAIELLEGSEQKTVRVDHPFHSGDKFRFKVSSNQDGWLYILHRSGSEELRLLWPRLAADNEDEYLDMNRIKANQTYTIPPGRGLFIFDAEIGSEYFYAVIADERKTPQLTAKGEARSEVITSKDNSGRSKRIVNFGVRSGTMTTAKSLRGVLYDPGKQDDDPFLYFASPANEDNQPIFVEFQLKHQE